MSDPEYEDLVDLDEDIVLPVSSQLFKELPHAEFTMANKENFSEENQSCTICQSNYELTEQYVILPCLHRFHTDCVAQWFDRRNTCPVCKEKVEVEGV